MKLLTAGREYAKWTVSAPAADALSISFDQGVTWHDMERPADGQARILVAGPLAVDNPTGTASLARGRNTAIIRYTENPEVVVREAGYIDVDLP